MRWQGQETESQARRSTNRGISSSWNSYSTPRDQTLISIGWIASNLGAFPATKLIRNKVLVVLRCIVSTIPCYDFQWVVVENSCVEWTDVDQCLCIGNIMFCNNRRLPLVENLGVDWAEKATLLWRKDRFNLTSDVISSIKASRIMIGNSSSDRHSQIEIFDTLRKNSSTSCNVSANSSSSSAVCAGFWARFESLLRCACSSVRSERRKMVPLCNKLLQRIS